MDRKQRFIDIHKNARKKAKRSQEYMALELGISPKTVRNWEKGISEPSFYESLEWFRALKTNPLPLYMSVISDDVIGELTPDISDDKLDDALIELFKNISPHSKRAILYLFMGEHGSSASSVLDLLLAHLHLPIKERIINASTVLRKYETERKLGNLICKNSVLPDIEHLSKAIDKAQYSLEHNEYGYNLVE